MSKDYVATAQDVVTGAGMLKAAVPEAMAGFAQLGKGAYAAGELSAKVKELMALAIAVTVRCDGCVAYHAKAAFEKGASRQEVCETIAIAVQMGGGPSMVYGGEVLRAYDVFAAKGA